MFHKITYRVAKFLSDHVNPCRAEFYLENIKIYVYLSFLNIEIVQAVGIFPHPFLLRI